MSQAINSIDAEGSGAHRRRVISNAIIRLGFHLPGS